MAGHDNVAAAIQMLVAALQQPQQPLTSPPPAGACDTEKETTPAPPATLSVQEQQAIVERVGLEAVEKELDSAVEVFDISDEIPANHVKPQHSVLSQRQHSQPKKEDDSLQRKKPLNPVGKADAGTGKYPLAPWDAFYPTDELVAVFQRKMVMGGWRLLLKTKQDEICWAMPNQLEQKFAKSLLSQKPKKGNYYSDPTYKPPREKKPKTEPPAPPKQQHQPATTSKQHKPTDASSANQQLKKSADTVVSSAPTTEEALGLMPLSTLLHLRRFQTGILNRIQREIVRARAEEAKKGIKPANKQVESEKPVQQQQPKSSEQQHSQPMQQEQHQAESFLAALKIPKITIPKRAMTQNGPSTLAARKPGGKPSLQSMPDPEPESDEEDNEVIGDEEMEDGDEEEEEGEMDEEEGEA